MGYYWVTTAQALPAAPRLRLDLRPVNQRQIELRIDQYGGDNSFFRDDKANITLGKGGVDDAEDAEVIVHEYGHSVQDGQVPGFGTTPRVRRHRRGLRRLPRRRRDELGRRRTRRVTPEACVADWDSVSYTQRPRRTASAVSTAPSTTPRTSSARSTPTARSGRGRCGTSAARSATPAAEHRSSSRRSSPSRLDTSFRDAAAGHRRRGAAPLRLRRGPGSAASCVRRARHPLRSSGNGVRHADEALLPSGRRPSRDVCRPAGSADAARAPGRARARASAPRLGPPPPSPRRTAARSIWATSTTSTSSRPCPRTARR